MFFNVTEGEWVKRGRGLWGKFSVTIFFQNPIPFSLENRHLVFTSSNNSKKILCFLVIYMSLLSLSVRSFFQLKKAPVFMKTILVLGFRPRFTLYVSADTKSFVHTGYFTHSHQIFPITSLTIVEQLCYQQFENHKSAVANV